jgi:chromosome segregation ATPase
MAGTAVLVVALLGSLAFGYTTNQSLNRTTRDLAATRQTLATVQSLLADTTTQLNAQTAARARADDDTGRLNNQVADLQNQLAARDACVAALQADEAQLQKIAREQVTQFNRFAEGSDAVKAQNAYVAALKDVALDYGNAESAAWNGNYPSANAWINAGNGAAARAGAQLKLYNAAIGTINAGTKKVEAEEAALAQSIANTLSLCQGSAGTI